jgi:hypothetical protein
MTAKTLIRRSRRSVGLVWAAPVSAILLGAASAAAADPGPVQTIPIDSSIMIGDVEAACTGIGQTRLDPRWAAYPIRLEFSNAQNVYLVDATVTVATAAGTPVLTARCDGPWLLLKLPKGQYVARAQLNHSDAKPRSARFSPPAKGQTRVVLQFPDAAGG